MAALYDPGNNSYRVLANRSCSMMQEKKSFVVRGGIWVLAQVPVMLAAFTLPLWFGAGHFAPRHPLAIVGVAVTLFGVSLAVWGLTSLGDALTPFPKPLYDASLHRQGAYRFMRHLIYAGLILASLGWALWWLSVIGLLYVVAMAIFFDRKAVYEEIWLRKKYRSYADYARRVKKFIPGVY